MCEHCGKKPGTIMRNGRPGSGTEFANISGEYKRDINDYVELCIACHKRYDAKKGAERGVGNKYLIRLLQQQRRR